MRVFATLHEKYFSDLRPFFSQIELRYAASSYEILLLL
jgi:hypothetical protein